MAPWFSFSLLSVWTDVLYMAHNFIKKSELTRIHVGQQWNNFLLLSQVESLRFRSLSHIFSPFLLAIDQCASYIHGMRSIIKGVHHKPQWNFKYQQVWEMTHDSWTLLEIYTGCLRFKCLFWNHIFSYFCSIFFQNFDVHFNFETGGNHVIVFVHSSKFSTYSP